MLPQLAKELIDKKLYLKNQSLRLRKVQIRDGANMYSGLPKIAPVCVCHCTVIPFSGVLMVTNRTLYKYISISAQAKLSGDARDQFRPGFRILLVGLGAGVALNYLEVIFFNCNLIFLSC